MTYSIFYSTKSLEIFCGLLAMAALVIGYFWPGYGRTFFDRVEGFASQLAIRPWAAIAAAAVFPMIVRLALLPFFPYPEPRVHDEFSYLLLGDTLAHGRVTNPTPPGWEHFETEYVLLRPTYASQYEPAPGVFLAAGELAAGHPWWGVWLSCGLMCAALCWGLGGILPLRWALLGSLIASLQFGIFGFWMNSYFGGAVAAAAGAMVFGSITRRRKPGQSGQSQLFALAAAVGIILLLASRPVEGILWLGVLVWAELSQRGSHTRFCAVFLSVFAAGLGTLAWYNKEVTGNPVKAPYSLYRSIYGTPQSYWWQAPVTITKFDHPELAANYEDQLRFWQRRYSALAIWDTEWRRLRDFWRFFVGPFLTPALLLAGFAVRRRKLWPWLMVSMVFVLDHATYHAWYPQQSAPETILIVFILVESWRQLRIIGRNRKFGVAISRQLVCAFAVAILALGGGLMAKSTRPGIPRVAARILAGVAPEPDRRDIALEQLGRVPGKHLVFVHYGAKHAWYDEWVFNGADLNGSRVVFARMCTPDSDLALARTMSDRDVWIADPDAERPLTQIAPAQLYAFARP